MDFSELFKKGLAYLAEVPVNWCRPGDSARQ